MPVYFLLFVFIRGLYKRLGCLSFIKIRLRFGQLGKPSGSSIQVRWQVKRFVPSTFLFQRKPWAGTS